MKVESGKLMKMVLLACVSISFHFPFSTFHSVSAQDTTKVSIKPYGFIRNYLNVDSRRMMTVCGGEYLMIPYDEDWNMTEADAATYGTDERFDRNAVPEAHLLALSTRFGLSLSGPTLMGWKSSGKLEADFAGFGTNNTILRLRLAYLKLSKGGSELLVGQDWHPLSGDIMPEVLGMAAGAPFRPHSRTPQIRSTMYWGAFGCTAALLWQYQFTSPGPDGESAAYANRSLVPEIFLGFNFRTANIYAQLGVDYSNLLIRQEIPVVDPLTDATLYQQLQEGRCHSFSPTFYFQYQRDLFSLKLRTTLARNLAHLNMLSGYAWAVNSANEDAYIPLQASVSYLDLAYGRKWRVNLFLGYQKNFGLADKEYNTGIGFFLADPPFLYMKKGVKNLNSIWRIAPSISYNVKAFNIGLEYELTACTYGDIDADGSILLNDNLRNVLGHRLCALVKYNF